MADSSLHNPSSPEITPKEEHVTLDKPESLNPFLSADQTLDDSKIWVSTPIWGIRGDIGINTFRNALRLGKREFSKRVVFLLDYVRLIWEDIIHKLSKKTREKVVPYPRFISILLEYMMPGYENEELTINPTQAFSIHNWALKPNQTKGPPFMVGEMHKEAQQAASGPTSLGATNEDGAHPQLSSGHDASADFTVEADPGLSAPNDSIPSQKGINEESRADEISKKIKLEDLSDLLKDTRFAFFTPDSPQDEPIIVLDESEEEEEVSKDKYTHASSHDVPEDTSIPHPPSPKSAQIQELMAHATPSYPDINQLTNLLVTSLNPKLSKLLASHNFASCLPTELNELLSKFTELSGEIKELKQHVAELKNIQWELPTELQALPVLVSSVQKQLKTLDSLPSLLNKVTETLNRFATVVENASEATTKDVPSAGQAIASPAEGEKNTTKDAKTNLQNELFDLLGIDVMEQYHNKKLLFDKYCDKMLKRRKSSKIINCYVITQKGPISLKVYREDGTIKVIVNFKVNDLHLA
ncbi:hypothetical protein Tco_0200676 [Tanacetum coccineum]